MAFRSCRWQDLPSLFYERPRFWSSTSRNSPDLESSLTLLVWFILYIRLQISQVETINQVTMRTNKAGIQQTQKIRYRCGKDSCSQTFSRTSDARRHEREIHQNPRKLCCPYLGCTFRGSKRNNVLRNHIRNHHVFDPSSSKYLHWTDGCGVVGSWSLSSSWNL